jgi:8-oxo-dGTP diphosphatase
MTEALKWEFPGGKVAGEESEQQALAREIEEELGIEVEVVAPIGESRVGPIELSLYECIWLRGGLQLVEHAQLQWHTGSTLADVEWAPADIPLIEPLLLHFGARLRP